MTDRITVASTPFVSSTPISFEDVARDAMSDARQLRAENAILRGRIETLEGDIREERRQRFIERQYRMIAQRDRDNATGHGKPDETANSWTCGKCGGVIQRDFVYCPHCCTHIDWGAVKFS
jgi:hypothetical protein